MFKRLDYPAINAGAIAAMVAAKSHVTSVDARLRALVELRVSQINGCIYCVDLHIREARAAGEPQARLDTLVGWRESPDFDAAERAALAWAEAMTLLPQSGAPDDLFEALQAQFTDTQIVDLTLITAQMNAWNRLAVAMGHLPDRAGDAAGSSMPKV